MGKYRSMAILAITFFGVIALCLILIITGIATPFIFGFAIDSQERIYIGTQSKIRIYEDGVMIDTIEPKTSRAYAFTINKDDSILLSTSTKIYILDLDGSVIHVSEDVGADLYNKIQYNKRRFTSASGDVYVLSGEMGWTHITKNGENIVYQISPVSFAVKILLAASVVALFVSATLLVIKYKTGDGSLSSGHK